MRLLFLNVELRLLFYLSTLYFLLPCNLELVTWNPGTCLSIFVPVVV